MLEQTESIYWSMGDETYRNEQSQAERIDEEEEGVDDEDRQKSASYLHILRHLHFLIFSSL